MKAQLRSVPALSVHTLVSSVVISLAVAELYCSGS
jgi:hypothetical protein